MYNQDNITKAWFFASHVHNGQLYPGEKLPYLTHLGNVMMEIMGVSSTLRDAELAIICAILHDTIEDAGVTYEELEKEFGSPVANGVMALTKNMTLPTKQEQMLDSLERIKQQPKELWAVKVADRISNLGKPPEYWTKEKVQAYHNEAKTILEYLGEGHELLSARLQKKIDDYSRYM